MALSHWLKRNDKTRPGSFGFPVVSFRATISQTKTARELFSLSTGILAAALATLLAAHFGGASLSGSTPTMVACAAILVFGLPHGALDLEIIKRERGTGRLGMGALLFLYLGLAATMAAMWHFAPLGALATFLLIAVIHFAEDWQELGSAFLAQGVAIALLTAPSFLHLVELEQLFEALSGRADAAIIANLMLLLAPMSLGVAGIAFWAMWRAGFRHKAMIGVLMLAGMTLLPPVVGFALFFCLFHSPLHLKEALGRVDWSPQARWIVPLLTFAALGIASLLFAGEVRADLPAQFVAASFMTLSLLTVPHMIVPAIVDALALRTSLRQSSQQPKAI